MSLWNIDDDVVWVTTAGGCPRGDFDPSCFSRSSACARCHTFSLLYTALFSLCEFADHVGFPRAGPQSDDFNLNPYPDKPRLTFKEDGTFNITVFSDLHYGENPWDAWGPQQDVNSTILMNTVLTSEKPDYVWVPVC